ncbi:MAG: DinB family protein [Dehalococcoidia bacterium]|nr:DinB family protein [Dehalococcoidia bacterium]
MNATWNDDNDLQRARLEQLLAELKPEHYGASLGGGWTVGSALAHLAFWDRRGQLIFEHWLAGETPPVGLPAWYEDLPNDVLLEQWTALPGAEAGRLALAAAAAIDAVIAALPAEVTDAVVARDEVWRMRRAGHRGEHVDQIREALGL